MNSAPEILLLHGKNGSGKSTVADQAVSLGIEKNVLVAHIPLGDILRKIAAGEIDSIHAEGIESDATKLAAHKPASTRNAMDVFREQIENNYHADLIIANGVPRYKERLPAFRELINDLGVSILAVCHLEVSDEVARERSLARARPGDDFEMRLKGYYQDTVPTIDALATEYPCHQLDGTVDSSLTAQKLLDLYFEADA